nr:MAG TPA: hypothetical protein [Caudoviricetes sp.]
MQINFYVFVFQRVANFGAKKENTPLQIYIDDALLYGFGCAFVWVALLYGLRFKKRKRTHRCKRSKTSIYAVVVPFLALLSLL